MSRKTELLLGFVLASEHRINVLRLLAEKPKRQVDLVRALNLHHSNASVIVGKLQQKGLLSNISKTEPWKVLSLTSKGKQITNQI